MTFSFKAKSTIVFTILMAFLGQSNAAPLKLSYQGKILNSDKTPFTYNNVTFEFAIIAHDDPSCVVYLEQVSAVDLSASDGVFDISFGANPTFKSAQAADMNAIFKNGGTFTCQNSSAYNPSLSASRSLRVRFNDGTSWRTLNSALPINSVPYASTASVADNSDSLGGIAASSYLQKPGAVCASGVMGFDGTSLTCTPISSLAVDWSALTGKPSTFAPSAHTHEVDAITSAAGKYFTYKPNNAACSTNDVLKWDGTRWICGTDNAGAGSAITDLTGDVTASGTGSVAATVANVGGKTAAQVATAVDDIAAVPTTYLAKAGGTMTGAIDMNQQNLTNTGHITMYPSKTLHLSNNASSPAGSYTAADSGKVWFNSVSNKLEYWDGSAIKVVGNEGGSAADLTSITGTGLVQRTGAASYSTLGIGSDFVITGGITLDLTNSGVTAGTYTKVTVDAKGRVTTGASLSASDVPNLDAGKITTGQFADAQISAVAVDKVSSGVGKYFTYAPNNVACADGEILKKTTNGWECAADATGGSPADSSYAAKGVVQFDTNAATSGIAVVSGVASVNAGTAANQIVKLDGTAKLPAVDGSALTSITTSVDKITSAASAYFSYKPNNVECADGEILKWTAATDRWECATAATGTVTSIVAGTGLTGGTITGSGTIGLDTELAGVNSLATTGFVQRTGSGTYSTSLGSVTAFGGTVVTRDGSGVSGFYGVGVQGSSAGTATIRAPSSFTNYALTLPADDGTNGQVLQTDGSGVLSWVTQSSGADNLGNHTATQNIQLGSNWLSGDGGNEGITVDANGNVGIGTASPVGNFSVEGTGMVIGSIGSTDNGWSIFNVKSGGSVGATMQSDNANSYAFFGGTTSTNEVRVGAQSASGVIRFHTGGANPTTFERMRIDSTGNVGVGTATPGSKLDVKGALRLSGSTSGYAGFQPAAAAGSTVWTLPTADGSNGQVLTTNGVGILSWSTPSSTPADASYAAKGIVQFDTDAATSGISVASGVASVNAGTAANQIVKLDGTAKLPAVDGSALTNITISVDKITSAASAYFSYKPNNVECADGEILKWTAATDRWECAAAASGTVTSIVAGTGLTGGTITGSGTIGLDTELAGVNSLASTGYVQRTGAGTYSTTAGNVAASNNTVVTRDGSGVSGFYGVGVQGSTAGTATIQAPASFTNYSLTLPADDGTNGQVLQTNGSGVLSWVNPAIGTGDFKSDGSIAMTGQILSSAGSLSAPGLAFSGDVDTGIFSSAADTLSLAVGGVEALKINTGAGPNFISVTPSSATPTISSDGSANASLNIYAKGTGTISLGSTGKSYFTASDAEVITYRTLRGSMNGTALIVTGTTPDASKPSYSFQGDTNSGIYSPGADIMNFVTGGVDRVTVDATGNVGVGTATPGSKLDVKGALRLSGSTSGYVGFQPAAAAGSTVWTLPTADGSNGQVLTTNGTGILSWSTPSSTPSDASYAAKGIVQFDTDAATSGVTVTSGVAKVNYGVGANQIVRRTASSDIVSGGDFIVTAGKKISMINADAQGTINILTPAFSGGFSLTLPTSAGTSGQVLSTDGTGVLSWINAISSVTSSNITNGQILGEDMNFTGVNTATSKIVFKDSTGKFYDFACSTSGHVVTWTVAGFACQAPTGDNLGNHTATANLQLGTNWLSGDGGNEGVYVATDGKVGIGTSSPGKTLSVNGDVEVANLTATSVTATTASAANLNGSILMVDGTVANWTNSSIRNQATNGYSGIGFVDNAGDNKGYVGYANSSASITPSSVTLGTMAATVPITFSIGATEAVRIAATTGNLGIGTPTPASKLQVSGTISNTVSSYTGTYTCGSSTIDFSTGNFQRLSPSNTIGAGSCSVLIGNLVAGASYTLVVTGNAATNAVTYSFGGGYTYKYLPTNAATTAGKDTIYTLLYDGTTVYVTWASGY